MEFLLGTSYVVDKLSNILRHRKVCPRMLREQLKLMQRTCPLCGQIISAKKLLKKHYSTKCCKEQQKRKVEGLPTRMYKYG